MQSSTIPRLTVLTLTLIVSAAAPAQAPLHFHFTESPGPHPVGLKVVQQYDYSRIYLPATDELGKPTTGERARPLQTLIWYPAEKSTAAKMTVADYSTLAATETSFSKPDLSPDSKKWIADMSPSLKDSMWSVRDAPLAPGHFPVVIYAPSFSAMSWENADLCEYLASNGYVVIASPDMGASTRDMTNDLAGINAQAADISFLVGFAQTLPDTDPSEIAVGGFSWGGISNLFAAARDSRIKALFALDGSMRYFPGLIKQAGDIHPDQMTIPLIYFAQGEMTIEDQARYLSSDKNTGPSVLNAWTHGDLITVHDLALIHTEHSSMYQRNENVWKGYEAQKKADYTRQDGITGYAWVSRYTLHFLDAYLKHDASALAWLKKTPAENGAPPHFLSVDFRPAKGIPATLDGFRAELGRVGFDHAQELYATTKKENPDFKLDEQAVNLWGYQLLTDGHIQESIALFKLNTQNYSDSSNTYDSLGDAYDKAGQKDLAIQSYKKALDKDPNNQESKGKLQKLEAAVPDAK
jgi:tetratricopeptide (TPR) repeat protein